MEITVLVENTTTDGSPLEAEHGLSLYISYKGKKYLLDAGSTGLVQKNAEKLGIVPEQVEFCMLSHGHYDHSGGFDKILRKSRNLKIYASDKAAGDYYSTSDGTMRYIGLSEELKDQMDHFIWVDRACELSEGIWAIPHQNADLNQLGAQKGLYKKNGDTFVSDDFLHEISYVFEMEEGLVICSSCSHSGVLNILREISEVLPGRKFHAFVGGLHMKGKKEGREISTFSKDEIHQLCEELKKADISSIYTGHCTGSVALDMLKEELGNRIIPLYTGMKIML